MHVPVLAGSVGVLLALGAVSPLGCATTVDDPPSEAAGQQGTGGATGGGPSGAGTGGETGNEGSSPTTGGSAGQGGGDVDGGQTGQTGGSPIDDSGGAATGDSGAAGAGGSGGGAVDDSGAAGAGGAGSTDTGDSGGVVTGDSGGGASDPYQRCVDRVNELRATLGLPPYERLQSAESCADSQAKSDSETGTAHDAFSLCKSATSWTKYAQNECPGWSSIESTLTGCLDNMWAEGPEGDAGKHGHYLNMTSDYTKMACGFYTTPDGEVWAVQDYWR